MAVIEKIEAVIGADDKQFRNKMNDAQKRTNEFTKSIQKMGTALAAAFAVNAVKNFLQESLRLADVQQKAEASLLTALRGREDAQQRLIKQAQELQKTTLFGDEETIKAQALLAQLGLTEDQITKLIPSIQDMATGLGMDLTSAATLVGKSLTSSTNALNKWGIEIEGAEGSAQRLDMALKGLDGKFKGQAETAAKTGLGPVKQLEMAWSDIREEIAERLIPVLSDSAKMFHKVLPDSIGILIDTFDKLKAQFDAAFSGIIRDSSFLQNVFSFLGKTVQIARIQISLLIEGVSLFFNQIATVGRGVIGIFNAIKNLSFAELTSAVTATGSDFITNFKETGSRMADALVDSFNIVMGNDTTMPEQAKKSGEVVAKSFGTGFNKGLAEISTIQLVPLAATSNLGDLLVKMEQAKPVFKSFQEAWAEVGRAGIDATETINQGLAMTAEGIGAAIGDLMSGVGGMQNIGAALLEGIAGLMGQLGQLSIGAGIAVAGIKKALMSLNPAVAIAGGVALVALAKAVSNKAKSLGGSIAGPGGGMPSVNSPTRTADTRSVSQTPFNITGDFRMQGKDLVAVIEKTEYTNSRVRR